MREPTRDQLRPTVDRLAAERTMAGRAHVQPLLEEAIDQGMPMLAVFSAVTIMGRDIVACMAVGSSMPGGEPHVVEMMVDTISKNLSEVDWEKWREIGRAHV